MISRPAALFAIALMFSSCARKPAPAPAAPPAPRFAELIRQENARWAPVPLLKDVPSLRAARLAHQEGLLSQFQKDPDGFVKKWQGLDRNWLFDAVIDGGDLMRIGRESDGGKWVSDPHALPPGAVVYSFGVGDDISFDTEMAGRFGCEVHLFDPAPVFAAKFAGCTPGMAIGKGRISWHDLGLGPTSEDPRNLYDLVLDGKKCAVKSLAMIAKDLGHSRVDILKVDIEGGELIALPASLVDGTFESLGVKQLLVEIHLWDDGQFRRFVGFIREMKKHGYEIFRKEFNAYDGARCAEFAFLRVR